jgi:hypothetical protein
LADSNPYSPPGANVSDVAAGSPREIDRLNRIASGQRLMIIAILVALSANLLVPFIGGFALVISFGASVASIVGVVRLAHALGSPGAVCFLFAVLMLVPVVNLVLILVMSMRATRALRAAGYQVGLLGAKAREAAPDVAARIEPVLPRE